MNILSLFDGISCGQVALERAGIKVNHYYASEIDKHAIAVARKNHPNTIHLGDVQNWREWNLQSIDVLIGGSPCQGFSFAGKQLNFDDPRSKLFFEYVDILNHFKPKYFLLENVKMKKEYQDIISDYLGVEPIEINSNLLSAQNRKRLYWTNIPDVLLPDDKGILLKDIVHERFEEMIFDVEPFNTNPSGRGMGGVVTPISKKHPTITTNKGDAPKIAISLSEYIVPFERTLKILDKEVQKGKIGYFRKDSQANRVYFIHNKAVTLCGDAGGGAAKMGQYLFGNISAEGCYSNDSKQFNRGLLYNKSRSLKSGSHDCSAFIKQRSRGNNKGNLFFDKSPTLTSNSWEQNNHLFGCITPDRVNKRQNGQRFNDGRKFYTLTAQDRHGVLIEGYIRKLTPIECERLQTLPDNYTEGISKTQRYKALGNGWTVDVIAHIFSFMPEIRKEGE